MAFVVVLVALIARELGAGQAGQALAALATAASAAAMAVGHLLSTTTFDVLVWVALVYVVARILGGGDERQWLLVGLVAGIGLENKQLVVLLVVALACGCLLARRWDLARSRWLWVGAALAFALWLPNLVWQAHHGWPQLELAAKIAEEEAAGNRAELLLLQLLFIGPLLAPLWLGGLWWLLRRPEARRYRPLGLAYVALLVIALVTGAKPYYTIGLLLVLVGAGGVVAETWMRDRRGRTLALGATIALSAAVAALITLPLVPVEDVHATPIPDINEDAIETIGWPTFTATVGRVWNELPRSERSTAVVYASNYGEAGAIARYGRRLASRAPIRGTTRSGASAAHPTTGARSSSSATTTQQRCAATSAAASSPRGSITVWQSTTKSKARRSGPARRPSRHGRGSGHDCTRSTRNRPPHRAPQHDHPRRGGSTRSRVRARARERGSGRSGPATGPHLDPTPRGWGGSVSRPTSVQKPPSRLG